VSSFFGGPPPHPPPLHPLILAYRSASGGRLAGVAEIATLGKTVGNLRRSVASGMSKAGAE
jgi:hypothetical protein